MEGCGMKVMDDNALKYASKIAYSSVEVLQFTYDMGVKYKDAPGCFVECGCAAGAQIIAFARAAPNKTIYAFDSFQGLPLPSNKDNQMPGIAMLTKAEQMALPDPGKQELVSSGAVSVSLDDFTDHLENAIGLDEGIGGDGFRGYVLSNGAIVRAHAGWFENTIPSFINRKDDSERFDDEYVTEFGGPNRVEKFQISILRLDGDLYNSTYVCLKHLYPKVIKGGLVIVDDWALPGCRQAVIDYFKGKEKPLFQTDPELNKNSTLMYWTK